MASKLHLRPLAVSLGMGAAIFALAGAAFSPSAARVRRSQSHVRCGDTITADTTLDGDLVDCPNNGIVIGADDITLDLNGHVIDGDGTPAAGCDPEVEFCDNGVAIGGHDGVTVMHGSVREFANGVGVESARHARLLGISSSSNLSFGIVFFDVARSLVRGSSESRNVPPEGDGMGVFGSRHIRILHNSIRRNGGPGIHVFESTHNLIKGNVFSRNREGGISLEKADRNEVRRNRCVRNGRDSIFVDPGNRNVIARNRIFRTGGSGVVIQKGCPRAARSRSGCRIRTTCSPREWPFRVTPAAA
jgi:parallel beta-helix repeat protein